MKRSTLTILVLGLAVAGAAHAEYRCDKHPLPRVDALACAKAAEGIPELRRFVERTKAIYGLYIMDYGIRAETAPVVRKTAQETQEKSERVAASAQR